MRSDLEQRLRAIHRAPAPGEAEHRRAHEDALVDAFARRAPRPTERRGRIPRVAIVGVLGAVAVGACALPAEYPVHLGHGLEITVDATRWDELEAERFAVRIGEHPGAERVEVTMARAVEEVVDGQGHVQVQESVRMQVFMLGDELDPDRVWDELAQEFPALEDAEVHDVPLSGMVQGTLGGQLSHRFLDLEIDQHGIKEAERQIMAELMAQGIAPEDASVDIETSVDDEGNHRIEVRVEAERP